MELDHPVTTVASTCTAAVSGVCVLIGLRLRKRNRYAAFRWMQRAVLIDLLLTRVLVFISNQFAAVPSLIIDLLLLATLELAIRDAAADQAAPDETVDVPVLDDSIVDGHRADVARPA